MNEKPDDFRKGLVHLGSAHSEQGPRQTHEPRGVNPTRPKVLTHSDVHRPSFLLCHGAHFCHRVSQVRGEGPIDVWLQLKKKIIHEKQKEKRMNLRVWTASLLQRLPGSHSPSPCGGPKKRAIVLRVQTHPRNTQAVGTVHAQLLGFHQPCQAPIISSLQRKS